MPPGLYRVCSSSCFVLESRDVGWGAPDRRPTRLHQDAYPGRVVGSFWQFFGSVPAVYWQVHGSRSAGLRQVFGSRRAPILYDSASLTGCFCESLLWTTNARVLNAAQLKGRRPVRNCILQLPTARVKRSKAQARFVQAASPAGAKTAPFPK